jgi:hypothetical protein
MSAGGTHSYLARRGLARQADDLGLKVARLGKRAGLYGLPAEAAEALVLVIPYCGFERVRLIDPADLQRFPGGRYRQPFGQPLELWDPQGWLDQDLERVLLIEGELNAASVREVMPTLPTIGLPGKRALKPELAARIARAVRGGTVAVWIDRHDADPLGFEKAIAQIAGRLYESGVAEVLLLPDTGQDDANDLLLNLGPAGARVRLAELLHGACEDAPRPKREPRSTQPRGAHAKRPRGRTSFSATAMSSALAELRELAATDYLPRFFEGVDFNGRGFALCPFHDERTPSLHAVGRHYFCHGCGEQGDLFDVAGAAWGLNPKDKSDFKELADLLASAFLGRRARV